MEALKDPISVRVARINSEIVGKITKQDSGKLLSREALLDTLQALYDECSLESLQKYDQNIAMFVERHKTTLKELKQLRVNLNDFEIKNVIGRGHFGEVHVVKEKQTGDIYAMKTLRKFDSDIKKTSFEEERNIMAYSNSHWLTSLQYAFQDSSYLFFVMEYHPGGDLLGLLYRQGGTLPESAATFYIAELVLALEDLHKMGYVHRDIKPDNILLDRCGHLKLADFGSAAKLNKDGFVTEGPPVGTPDYIAPEVLQSLDNKKSKEDTVYDCCCDFWSLGVLAYELTIGNTPFTGQNSTSVYSKIMNHSKNLAFPNDVTLSLGYINFIKGLVTDKKNRLTMKQIKTHAVFKNTRFENLKEEVPPFVPKIISVDDTSNFTDIGAKKKNVSVENLKRRTQFSGRNLPFIGFTFTHDPNNFESDFERKIVVKDEIVQDLKSELLSLQRKVLKGEEYVQEKECIEKKLEEKNRKVESLESLRDRLERDIANNISECTALKRTLELERKDRTELERKALDLIKAAKTKWETAEKNKVEALILELEQQKEKISQLKTTNKMLNEQLQHALKMEDRHKESLEKVQNLSRRSVIGLESRLEKVTSETQNHIHDMQKAFSEEKHARKMLEKKLKKTEEQELILIDKLKDSEEKYNAYKEKVSEAEDVIQRLGDKLNTLESNVDQVNCMKEQIDNLQSNIETSQKMVKDLENKYTLLKIENKKLEEIKRDYESKKSVSVKKIHELESKLVEEKEKNTALKKTLNESEKTATDCQELKELRSKFWRMEKDFGNCKIDKRILERELKDANSDNKILTEKMAKFDEKLAENKRQNETALLELSQINENISLELMKAKESYRNLQEKLENEKEKSDDEKTIIQELKSINKTKEEKVNSLTEELRKLKIEKIAIDNEMKKCEMEKNKLLEKVEKLEKEKSEVYNDLQKSFREISNTNLNLGALREACTLLENQVIEYEKINAAQESKQQSLNANTEKLIKDLSVAKKEILDAKKLANEEKSLKLLAETKVKRLNDEIECLQNECKSYQQQCVEYKQYSQSLADDLTSAEEKITDLEVNVKSYERQIEELVSENNMLKEEISDNLTQIIQAKESNFKLNGKYEELKGNKNILIERLQELEDILREKMQYYRERELKSDSTIQQQTKLIDYLQTKIDEHSQKKKTLSNMIFGHSKKENQPPLSLAMNYKDLEQQLTKERNLNKTLQEEIYHLKAKNSLDLVNKINTTVSSGNKVERRKSEVASPKMKKAMQQLVTSPSKQSSELYRQNSVQRMHHNIPHRFDSKLCTRPLKCAHCGNQMTLGRNFNSCKECSVVVHPTCASNLPRTCGLPEEFAQHYKNSMSKLTTPEGGNNGNAEDEVVNVEGWVKLPSKSNTWEKRYVCLTNSWMKVYSGPANLPDSTLVDSLELKPENSNGKVVLEPLVSEIGAPVANSDLPFILKIEVAPNTTCWPPKCLIIMTLSAQEKDMWFSALQKIFHEDLEKQKAQTILDLPDDLTVNCLVDLSENIKVLGTQKGLYSYYNENLLHIEALQSVHQISVLKSGNVVIMIVNPKATLISCDLNHLINLTQCSSCVKPTLKYKNININNLNGFHILQVSENVSHQKLCVATSKQIVICDYILENSEFLPLRILDTAEPTSCMLFTENTLIVGANKFFEIDLNTFEAEEFLDVSDEKLKQAVKCYKMGSFPLSLMEISKNPKEYLLCFNEFSIFVDEYGRSSRQNEIKSNHLPLVFKYIKPYLFVVQFSAIEIIKLTDETCNSTNDSIGLNLESVRVEFEKFQYLGANNKGIYITQKKQVKYIQAKMYIENDDSSVLSESTDLDSDRFSFTSSMVQSLDGHLTDDEELNKGRKVTFSQTDL